MSEGRAAEPETDERGVLRHDGHGHAVDAGRLGLVIIRISELVGVHHGLRSRRLLWWNADAARPEV